MKLCLSTLEISAELLINDSIENRAAIIFTPMAKPCARWQLKLRQWHRRRKCQAIVKA